MAKFTCYLLLLLSSSFAFAHSEAATEKEIAHLLDFVENTECSYQRNGSDHDGESARKHIQIKYDFYHDDIKTAEDFIDYSATKSNMSGKKYTITCAGEEVQYSGDWLKAELINYRAQSLEK